MTIKQEKMRLDTHRSIAVAVMLSLPIAQVALSEEQASLIDSAKRDPLGLMQRFKAAWEQFPDEISAGANAPRIFQLDSCLYTDDVLNKDRDHNFMVSLQETAGRELLLASELKRAGYPETSWRAALDDFIKAEVAIISKRQVDGKDFNIASIKKLMRPQEKAFRRVLNEYRRSSRKRLPQFDDVPFCGGDFIGFFKVKTSPRGGTVRLIREYFFQLCRLAGIDPYSNKCDMWLAASASAEFPQGVYRYVAHWGDGAEECDKADFTPKKEIELLEVTI